MRRNIDNPSQVTRLTRFRSCVGRADAPVLIDQEGPRGPPAPAALGRAAARRFARQAIPVDPVRGIAAAKVLGRILASQLSALGINVNHCAPVLDLRIAEADKVIGDRAFSSDPKTIAALGRALCDGLRVGGVMPVIKHLPGHGRAMADSHHALPVVETSLDTLEMADLASLLGPARYAHRHDRAYSLPPSIARNAPRSRPPLSAPSSASRSALTACC